MFYLSNSYVNVYVTEVGVDIADNQPIAYQVDCPTGTQMVTVKLPLSDLNSQFGESMDVWVEIRSKDGTTVTNIPGFPITYDYSNFLQRTTWLSYRYDSY